MQDETSLLIWAARVCRKASTDDSGLQDKERFLARLAASPTDVTPINAAAVLCAVAMFCRYMKPRQLRIMRLDSNIKRLGAIQPAWPWFHNSNHRNLRVDSLTCQRDELVAEVGGLSGRLMPYILQALQIAPNIALSTALFSDMTLILAGLSDMHEIRRLLELYGEIRHRAHKPLALPYYELSAKLIAKDADCEAAIRFLDQVIADYRMERREGFATLASTDRTVDRFRPSVKQNSMLEKVPRRPVPSSAYATNSSFSYAWGIVLSVLIRGRHLDAQAAFEEAAKVIPVEVFHLVLTEYAVALSNSGSVALDQLRTQLHTFATEIADLKITFVYRTLINRCEHFDAKATMWKADLFEDLLDFAAQGRFKLRIVELAVVIDFLLAYAHASTTSPREALRFVNRALDLYTRFDRMRAAGQIEEMAHPAMPHGIVKRLVGALSRIGCTARALRLSCDWVASVPEMEATRLARFSLGKPLSHWFTLLGEMSLGRFISGQKAPNPRHLALWASRVLHYDMLASQWLLQEACEAIDNPSTRSMLDPKMRRGLRRLIERGSHVSASAVSNWVLTIEAKRDRVEEPDEDANLHMVDYSWPTPRELPDYKGSWSRGYPGVISWQNDASDGNVVQDIA